MTTTWDPAKKSTGTTLSNGNLTGTYASGGNQNTQSVDAFGSGKFYFEYVITATNGNESNGVGLATTGAGLNTDFVGYISTTSIGAYADTGNIYNSSTLGALSPAPTLNSVMGVAFDSVNKKVWFRPTITGNWNGAAIGSQNPATNTGGYSTAAFSPTTIYAAFTLAESGNAGTARFSSASWTGTPPAGFGEINPSAGSGASVSGAALTSTASIARGALGISVSRSGAALTSTASITAGTLSLTQQRSGATLTANATLLAGTATANAVITGAAITANVSLLAGLPSAYTGVPGADLIVAASLITSSAHLGDGYGMGNYGEDPAPADAYGTPRHTVVTTLAGVDLPVIASISRGALHIDQSLPGISLVANASVLPGAIVGGVLRPGAALQANAILIPGNVTAGGSIAITLGGITAAASIAAGRASVSYAVSGAALGVVGSILPAPIARPGVDFQIPVLYQPGFPYIVVNVAVSGRNLRVYGAVTPPILHGGSFWTPLPPDDEFWQPVLIDEDDFGPWVPVEPVASWS